MRRLRILLATLSVLLIPIATPVLPGGNVLAASAFKNIDCSGAAAQSAVCSDKNQTTDPLTGSNGVLLKITNIMAVIAGIAAVIILIMAGLRFVTSGGSAEDIAGARRTIIYACVGLAVIALARVIIGFVLGRIS